MSEIDNIENDNPKQEGHEIEQTESGTQDVIIPEEVKSIIKDLPEPKQKEAVRAISVLMKKETFRSPLPPPEYLIGYNEALPDGANRIVTLIESQSTHRMERERTVMDEQLKQSRNGQLFGFIIAISFLITAGFLIYTGHEISGTILGSIDLVALVSVFVLGQYGKKTSN